MTQPTDQQCQSTEGGWLVIQIALNLTRLISPCSPSHHGSGRTLPSIHALLVFRFSRDGVCISSLHVSPGNQRDNYNHNKYGRCVCVTQYGCLAVLNFRLRPAQTSIERLREQFCTNNFYEVSEAVAKTNSRIPPPMQDIFMEQGWLVYNTLLHITVTTTSHHHHYSACTISV